MVPTSSEDEDTPYTSPVPESEEDLSSPPGLVEEHYPPDPNAPRHKAAFILSIMFSGAFLTVIAAEMVRSVYYERPISETATTLMLTVGSLLVGLSSGYLARNLNTPPGDRHELQTRVGTVMVATLGGMLVLMALAHLAFVVFRNTDAPLSENALNIMVVLLGGIVGSLGGYLGIRADGHSK